MMLQYGTLSSSDDVKSKRSSTRRVGLHGRSVKYLVSLGMIKECQTAFARDAEAVGTNEEQRLVGPPSFRQEDRNTRVWRCG